MKCLRCCNPPYCPDVPGNNECQLLSQFSIRAWGPCSGDRSLPFFSPSSLSGGRYQVDIPGDQQSRVGSHSGRWLDLWLGTDDIQRPLVSGQLGSGPLRTVPCAAAAAHMPATETSHHIVISLDGRMAGWLHGRTAGRMRRWMGHPCQITHSARMGLDANRGRTPREVASLEGDCSC